MLYLCGSLLWLMLGLIPALAAAVPALRHGLESLA
jgi:hypothetical protein